MTNEAGWVPVDRRTLSTPHEGVYAIGDVTAIPIPGRWKQDVPLMLPKAGVFAHDQARVVARRIAAAIMGSRAEEEFCGDGYCMLEAGEDLAGFAFGNFFGEPAPEVRLRRVGRAWHLGKVPVDVGALGVDLLTIVGHKVYGPKGAGALHVRRGTPLRPFVLGAGHEGGLRPGTENVASIVGLGVACERARLDLAAESARVRALRDMLWRELSERLPGLALNGHSAERLPNTLSVRFPSVSGSAPLEATPSVAASTGSACHAGHEEAPAVVVAMNVPSREALGTVRLTLGRGTSDAEVLRAAQALAEAWRRLSRR